METQNAKFKKGQTVIHTETGKVLIVAATIFNTFNWLYAFTNSPAVCIESDLSAITPTKSVIDGKNGTIAGVIALALSLQRGKGLIK